MATLAVAAPPASAVIRLVLQNHRFTPSAVTAPAGRKLVIELTNLDGSAEEFDSGDLRLEQDIAPKGHIRFAVGPLRPGVYRFMGEAHPASALGILTVTP